MKGDDKEVTSEFLDANSKCRITQRNTFRGTA